MMQQIRFQAMGCHITAIVDDPSPRTRQALYQVPVWFEEWEQSLSRFREDSELMQLNRSTGKPYLASDTLWEVVRQGLLAHKMTAGLVTPAILPAVLHSGYSADYPLIRESSPMGNPNMVYPEMDVRRIHMNTMERAITLPPGMQLDFGGIAKGWAAQRAAERLRAYGPSLVNAGGDISISAQPNDQPSWQVGVRDPSDESREVQQLHVKLGGIATSGKDYRKWTVDGQTYHHIMDPRTQKPAETDILTATVVAPTTIMAEIAAKAILILGSKKGLQWIQTKTDHFALAITDDYLIQMTGNFREYIFQPEQESLVNDRGADISQSLPAPHHPHIPQYQRV